MQGISRRFPGNQLEETGMNRRRSSLFGSVLLLPLALAPAVAHADDPVGQWARQDGASKVDIARCGSNICATNTWIKPGNTSEKKGDILVMTLKPVGAGDYQGSAFDPQRKLNYRLTLKVEGRAMTTRGCVLGGLLCKSVAWSKIR